MTSVYRHQKEGGVLTANVEAERAHIETVVIFYAMGKYSGHLTSYATTLKQAINVKLIVLNNKIVLIVTVQQSSELLSKCLSYLGEDHDILRFTAHPVLVKPHHQAT